ncbi:hypothetical protein OGAPHI_002239 [Ogataea philodendri]|uniref:Uncharacterized protein n=1 Tax=Ogataea philodendri TaxID=1378263 RepID=A0A9P8PBF5_9ASCO|nr:uncharacterized protein OGAPHI_002239 [Ogataea philodendri]KAH3668485.1 hypothetical protein OGAPHI_002239 [Ogataea philodendri]
MHTMPPASTQLQISALDLSNAFELSWTRKRRHAAYDVPDSAKKSRPSSVCSSSSDFVQKQPRGIPDVVIRQAHFAKSNVFELLDTANASEDMYFLEPGSSLKIPFNQRVSSFSLPMILTFFGVSKVDYQLLDLMTDSQFEGCVLGVTSNYEAKNNYNFPILVDTRGVLARHLHLSDPLGGGTYPLASVMIFDRQGVELVKILVNYDYKKYYSSDNSLREVFQDVLEYINAH